MNNMTILSAQYVTNLESTTNSCIRVTTDEQVILIPLDPANRHYSEIMRQVEAGTLTIEEAE